MAGKFKTTAFWASLGKYEVEEGIVFKEQVEEESQRYVDIDDYAQKLQDAYEQLDAEGYDVVNVVPICLGTSETRIAKDGTYLGDMGFSPTRGAVVVGKKQGG